MIYSEVNIQLQHKKIIEEIRYTYNNKFSSHAFNSIYLWRHIIGNRLVLLEDMFTVRCKRYDENTWFFPCGSDESKIEFIKTKLKEPRFRMEYAAESDVAWTKEHFPDTFDIIEEPDSDEYVCDIKEHIRLEGSRYHDHRKRVNKLNSEHSFRIEAIDDNNIELAVKISDGWSGKLEEAGVLNTKGNEVDVEAFNKYKELSITGIIVYMDENPVFVIAGYPLGEDTYDLMISKECVRVRGLDFFAIREFEKTLDKKYIYLNCEEDLGIEGLKECKNQLRPVFMNKMWRLIKR